MWKKFDFLNRHNLIILKLLFDSLFLFLFFFLFLMIANGILPGIVSNYFRLADVLFLISANIALIVILEKKYNLSFTQKANKKAVIYLLLPILLLLLNAFYRLDFWLNIFLTILSFFIGYYFYKVFFED